MTKGIFTISLDFELHWGGFEKWPLGIVSNQQPTTSNKQANYNQYFLNTRQVIPQMLESFRAHEVHVSWATVGMLFHKNKMELLDNAPTLKPSYKETQLSAYLYVKQHGIGENEEQDPFHFAPSLINQICQTPHQELGTHTFAHYYCNEAGQTLDQFREDIKAAQRVAHTFGVRLKSLVFPRNQFNDQYLKVCYEEGISSVRSNPLDWFWHIESTQAESAWKRLNRGLDAYFPVGKRNTYKLDTLEVREGYPICIPSSRLLRPYRPKEYFLNTFKINRIKAEMTRAAEAGEVYHLWWHPHNFGNFPTQSMAGLNEILNHYSGLNKMGKMISMNMGEIEEEVRASRSYLRN